MTALVGDYPGRVRIIVTDTSGHDQKGLIWGMRAKHYDPSATAALFYEAEAMTPLNGSVAQTSGFSAASEAEAVYNAAVPAGVWSPILLTDLLSGGPLTHVGSYRVWVRAFCTNNAPQVRLAWNVGDYVRTAVNDAVTLVGPARNYYLLDLGEIRIDAPPVGSAQWRGIIQAMPNSLSGGDIAIDCMYLQPVDDGAASLQAVQEPSPIVAEASGLPGTGSNSAGAGITAWTNPGNITGLTASTRRAC
jgi:hypothetical protein